MRNLSYLDIMTDKRRKPLENNQKWNLKGYKLEDIKWDN